MGQKFAIVVLVLVTLGACKSQKTEISKALAAPATPSIPKSKPIVEKPKPSIFHMALTVKVEDGAELVRLDTTYRKDGKIEENFAKITSDEHRLRLIFKSEDGIKKKYYWLRHPLFLKITVPNKDGKMETIEITEKETTLFFKNPYAEWYHSVDVESFAPRSAGKLIGTVLL